MTNKTNSILNVLWVHVEIPSRDWHTHTQYKIEPDVDIDIENEPMQMCWYVQGHYNQLTDKITNS